MRFSMIFVLVVVVTGCVAPPKTPTGAPTALRTTYADAAWPALAKALEAEGFEPTLLTTSRQSQGGSDAADNTEQDESAVTFRTTRDGLTGPLTTSEGAAIMSRLKADFSRRVTADPLGEVLGVTETEGYQERTLAITYRLDQVHGTATFRWAPWTEDGELVNRLEVTFREQPPPP